MSLFTRTLTNVGFAILGYELGAKYAKQPTEKTFKFEKINKKTDNVEIGIESSNAQEFREKLDQLSTDDISDDTKNEMHKFVNEWDSDRPIHTNLVAKPEEEKEVYSYDLTLKNKFYP